MKVLTRKFDKEKTQKEFKSARWIYGFWAWLTEREAIEQVVEFAEVQNGNAVLDVACGTGEVLSKILKLNPNGLNVGIDLSPDMLQLAKKKLDKVHLSNYDLREGNVLNLDFSDNTFNLLFNNYMVDLMPENTFDKIASEFYRVLKPEGILVMSTFSFGTKRIHHFWYWVAKKFPDLLTGCRPLSFKEYLLNAGFVIENELEISQNTFPSQVIKARKLVKP